MAKCSPIVFSDTEIAHLNDGSKNRFVRPVKIDAKTQEVIPPYDVGTRLWIRERFAMESNYTYALSESASTYPPPFNDGRPTRWYEDKDFGAVWEQCHYATTDEEPCLLYDDSMDTCVRWRSPVTMPRWASRFEITISEVETTMVQDISIDDIITEGFDLSQAHAGWPMAYVYTFSIQRKTDQ